ncbi:MAG: thioredoxin reductase protein [Cypionkella sp.]|uniref:NAD(P)/FAD-dependent oxidoreductase n=1 Tax=Cypionkella sp. TaxID=2811411 RepID=UPI0026376818|nr:NAD(P)/FAD-dependent oxidoreductase [Cypionkella sp.]MDB5658147.1 thioredoxin reductase protein [Cypionkella sp.]
MKDQIYDCVIVGGGPGGLTAAIYLARSHLSVAVVDDGHSRAAMIPLSRNQAGFPDGISGSDLLARMRSQASKYDVTIQTGHVEALVKTNDVFVLRFSDSNVIRAQSVLLATGVRNRRPAMPDVDHDAAVARGLMRYCPVCDAYEITDRRIGVIGTGDQGIGEAVFLRSFTDDITFISPDARHDLSCDQSAQLEALGIKTISGPIAGYEYHDDAVTVITAESKTSFSSVYLALGSDVRSGLAEMVGAELTEDGYVSVDRHQRASIAGLYAAGDVVLGLDQITNAMGQGSVAAIAIRNDLFGRYPSMTLRRIRKSLAEI